jgi:hypothetical protein
MAKIELVNDATVPRTQHYPDKDGVFAMTSDITGGASDHYRGTDHTSVVSPVAGDYTLEDLTTVYWTLPVKFEYLTSWERTTALFLGSFGLDESFASAANSLGLSNFVVGDLIAVTQSHAMTSSHTDVAAWDGAGWVNISNSDYKLELYGIQTTLDPLPQAVSDLEAAVTALQNYEPPQYYLGSDHTSPTGTPIAGAYTVEAGGIVWVYDTSWTQVGGGTSLQYWEEAYSANGTVFKAMTSPYGVIFSKGSGNAATGTLAVVLNGYNNSATEPSAAVLGIGNSASAVAALAAGSGTKATASASFSTGSRSRAFCEGMIATGRQRTVSDSSQSSVSAFVGTGSSGAVTVNLIDGAVPDATAWTGVAEVTGVVRYGSPNVLYPFKLVVSLGFASGVYSVQNPRLTILGGDFVGFSLSISATTLPAIVLTPDVGTPYISFNGTLILTLDRA